ncbi:MAG: peptidoglycan-binding protein [Verrucomicrobiota bacterium]|nr:peptidoglycan-binding protein [Verrucomicrobiota bacterium]MDQ6938725.1 peptidoglycan-binding protein [Verrucomicrobiota bacterium]
MNKLTLLGSVAAVALLAWPLTSADAGSRGARAATSVSAGSRGFSSNQFAGRPAPVNRTAGSRFNGVNGNGRWTNGGNGNWNNGNWHHHHHHGHVFVGFYPYWSPWWDYGYGYPYGYGYGYGYYPYGSGYSNEYRYGNEYRSGGNLGANVQQALAREGYYRGPIDGVIGARTRSAIRAYERANGLHVDGVIDQRLLQTMGLA